MPRALFYLLQWTWGLLQNIVGALICVFIKNRYVMRFRYATVILLDTKPLRRFSANVSLGMFIVMSLKSDDPDFTDYVSHEYGHTIQSLIYGPLYLFVVGITSFIWNRLFMHNISKYRYRKIRYTSRFPERQANWLAQKFTGIRPTDI